MDDNQDELKRRLFNAQESLDQELKSWIDPASPTGVMEIVRTCIALRNNNGGFLLIGMRDDGLVDERAPPMNVREAFHHDKIQEIISKYSSEAFEITVDFVEREGADRVLIGVPRGVRIPVICRLSLPRLDTDGRKAGSMLTEDTVYVRTLSANGRPSTAPPKTADWSRLMEICFDNREADIGAFIRRQLSGIDIGQTSAALLEVLNAAKKPTPKEAANELLDLNYEKFIKKRGSDPLGPPKTATREFAAMLLGDFETPSLTRECMFRLGAETRRYSGWTPWVDILTIPSGRSRANIVGDGWESYFFDPQLFNILEFARIEASGKFYYLEGLRDDLSGQVTPGESLEFVIETRRVTECLATALTISRAFIGTDASNDLAVAVRWRGLSGRRIVSWAERGRHFVSAQTAHDDEVTTYTVLPVNTPLNAIAAHALKLIKPTFMLFGGWAFEDSVLESIVSSTLNASS